MEPHANPPAAEASAPTADALAPRAALGSVVTLAELAAHLNVPLQTIYDLRGKGRGPRAFRVGRELRVVRLSEALAWIEQLEAADSGSDVGSAGEPR